MDHNPKFLIQKIETVPNT